MRPVTPEREWDPLAGEETERLPRRPRRQWLTWRSAALGALVTCAVGFYAGIRVEKGQLAGSTTATLGGATAAARSGGGGFSGGLRGARRGAPGVSGTGGGGGGAGATFGTVASVAGRTIDVTEVSGNTVRVRLSSATRISKAESVKRGAIRPGDTVIVTGVSGSGGALSAASVTDSGPRAGGSTGSGSTGSGSTGSGLSSLFSSGG